MAASRFPGKPLAKILGLPMIEHVRRRVCLCRSIDEVYVATCDNEIRKKVESYGGNVIMTSKKHVRCTDRIEEAARKLNAEIIVNAQGDEPLLVPATIDSLIKPFKEDKTVKATCIIYPITDAADLDDINTVKAVLDRRNRIMYFSRSAIPNYKKGIQPLCFEQSGIMAYRKDFLHAYSRMAQTPLEKAESVDMLRIIENGYTIHGVIVKTPTVEVDIPEHIERAEKAILNDRFQKAFFDKIKTL
jgi:3-deoxy-manno-octulosonate cytidylyltransferase (CMP-KDO synthetase)